MLQVVQGKGDLRFKLERSCYYKPTLIIDTDFTENIPLITEETSQIQELLSRVETETGKVFFHLTKIEPGNTRLSVCL